MSQDAIMRLEKTELFQMLVEKEKEEKLGHSISERVKAVVEFVSPLLSRISDNMPEYTLHDPNHGAKVVDLMGMIIPQGTLDHLNVIEISCLIYSGYLHDIGMTCSLEEKEKIIREDEAYRQLLTADTDRIIVIENLKKEDDFNSRRAITLLEDQVFTEYLRRNHVARSAKFIQDNLTAGAYAIEWQGTPYFRHVISICDSHALPVKKLKDTSRWQRDALIKRKRVNVQYLSLVLRLADILDLDPERTPKSVYQFVNPKDPTSIIEWKKHLSIVGWEITPERIRFDAECSDPDSERALRVFLDWIEEERRESVALSSSYRDDISRIYYFDILEPVTKEGIRSNGSYIYSDLRFEIDYRRVLELLMGQRLYRDPVLALRELLQNAFDAVKCREAIERREGNLFIPEISVKLINNCLIIEDNGIGMDEYVFSNYFIKVGRSYYSSSDFKAQNLEVDATSEFGIGVLSVFMIADRFKVESTRRPSNTLYPYNPINIEIPTAHGYFVKRPSQRTKIGTTITLDLKGETPFDQMDLYQLIERLIPLSDFSIGVQVNDEKRTYSALSDGELIDKIMQSNQSIKSYLQFSFDGEESINIEGKVNVIWDRDFNRRVESNTGVLSQRGFNLISSESEKNFRLFPQWLSVIYALNFKGNACLTLTPDRENIVADNRYQMVKETIEKKMILEFREYLANKLFELDKNDYYLFMDELIEKRVIRFDRFIQESQKPEVRQILLDFLYVPILDENGQRTRMLAKDLVEHHIMVFVSRQDYWPTGVSDVDLRLTINSHFESKPPIVNPPNSVWNMLLETLLGIPNELLVTSISGIVAGVVRPYEHNPQFLRKRDVVSKITTMVGVNEPLITYYSNDNFADVSEFSFNGDHRLFSEFISNGTIEKEQEKALHFLQNKLVDLFFDIVDELGNIRDFELHLAIRNQSPNVYFIGVFNRIDDFFQRICACIEEFWDYSKQLGIVNNNCPIITLNDFPWHWSISVNATDY